MKFRERTTTRPNRVDEAAGYLYGVKLIGRDSKNNRVYPPDVLTAAAPLYEGAKVFFDHNEEERGVLSSAGVVENVRFANGALWGDIKLRKAGQHFSDIIEIATDFSTDYGLSHVVDGETRWEDDVEIVESITAVFSVDIVCDPASTTGLWEQAGMVEPGLADTPDEAEFRFNRQQQGLIDDIVELAQRQKETATTRVRIAFERGDSADLGDNQTSLQELQGLVRQFIQLVPDHGFDRMQDELDRIFEAIADALSEPTQPNAPLVAAESFDELIGVLQRIQTGREFTPEGAASESVKFSAADSFTAKKYPTIVSMADIAEMRRNQPAPQESNIERAECEFFDAISELARADRQRELNKMDRHTVKRYQEHVWRKK